MPAPIDFRAVVVEAMARTGYNAHRLSNESGVGYSSVHGFINGNGGMTAGNLGKLFGVLGVKATLPRVRSK